MKNIYSCTVTTYDNRVAEFTFVDIVELKKFVSDTEFAPHIHSVEVHALPTFGWTSAKDALQFAKMWSMPY